MADQNLNIQVAATATGDGLRKTAEEVKALNAETAKSAPIAAEATAREERLAAVRERHAEAARQQAAAEAELDAKREAAFAELDARKAQGGGQGAGADAGGGGRTGVGAMAGVMAGQMVNEIPQAIQVMINSMEDQRISMQKQTAELSKQVAAWGDMVAAAGTVEDRLKLQLSMHERAAEIMERAAQAPVAKGNALENLLDNVKGLFNANRELFGVEERFEYSWDIKAREAEEQARIERIAGLQRDKKMIEQHIAREDELKRVSKMTLDERFERETMEIANLEQRRDEALANDQVREAYRAQIMIGAAEKRMAAIQREGDELAKALDKERDALEKLGKALDDNMRKEGERFIQADKQATRDFNALQEKGAADQRAREVAAEEARASLMAAEFDREEKDRQKAQREQQQAAEKVAREQERDAKRQADEEARHRTKFNIPPPGFVAPADAPPRDTFREAFPRSAASVIPQAAAESARASAELNTVMTEVVAMLRAKAKADTETASKLRPVVSQSQIHS